MMRKFTKTTTLAALAGLALAASSAHAATIYSETFSGTGDLNGTTPDTGANTWVASTDWNADWNADGSITGSTSGTDDDSAFLSFAPTSGNVYTLSATVTQPTSGFSTSAWVGLGFTASAATGSSGGTGFYSAPNNASPWMLYRVNSEVKTYAGSGTAGSAIEGNYGGTITLSIELDTTAAQWTAEWFVNGSSVRAEAYSTNPTITHVGFGREDGASSTLTSFSLTAIPEPGAHALLAGLTGLVFVMLRRRR